MIGIIEQYERVLTHSKIPKERMSPKRTFQGLSPQELLAHAHALCEGAKTYARDPEKWGKANRHFAAIQMCLSFAGWYTLADLKDHNRTQ
jgi:hypothetical protein